MAAEPQHGQERRRTLKLLPQLKFKSGKCPECDQPMLPKGVQKRPNEYDHASGCPNDPKRKAKAAGEVR